MQIIPFHPDSCIIYSTIQKKVEEKSIIYNSGKRKEQVAYHSPPSTNHSQND
jgi:hypothetical protein